MKIVSNFFAASLVVCFALPIKSTKAVPTAAIAPAICVGTGGVGCVLIGTAIIGGTIYYVWQSNNKSIVSDDNGTVISTELPQDIYREQQQDCAWVARQLSKKLGGTKKVEIKDKTGKIVKIVWKCELI